MHFFGKIQYEFCNFHVQNGKPRGLGNLGSEWVHYTTKEINWWVMLTKGGLKSTKWFADQGKKNKRTRCT